MERCDTGQDKATCPVPEYCRRPLGDQVRSSIVGDAADEWGARAGWAGEQLCACRPGTATTPAASRLRDTAAAPTCWSPPAKRPVLAQVSVYYQRVDGHLHSSAWGVGQGSDSGTRSAEKRRRWSRRSADRPPRPARSAGARSSTSSVCALPWWRGGVSVVSCSDAAGAERPRVFGHVRQPFVGVQPTAPLPWPSQRGGVTWWQRAMASEYLADTDRESLHRPAVDHRQAATPGTAGPPRTVTPTEGPAPHERGTRRPRTSAPPGSGPRDRGTPAAHSDQDVFLQEDVS